MLLLSMRGFRLSRNVLAVLFKRKGPVNEIEAYRFYVIARFFYAHRSSLFSIDEFLDILYMYFDYTSFDHSGRRRHYYKKFQTLFRQSVLFRECPDGRFHAIAEQKIVNKYAPNTPTYWFEAPLEIVRRKGSFKDFCIGIFTAGNSFKSNDNLAKQCSCSKRRIQYATHNNLKRKHFRKQYNFIEHIRDTYEEIARLRAELFNDFGISTPPPAQDANGRWVLFLNAPNSYVTLVTRGVKGNKQSCPPGVQKKVNECWFIKTIQNLARRTQSADELRDFSKPIKETWWFNADAGWNFKTYKECYNSHAKDMYTKYAA